MLSEVEGERRVTQSVHSGWVGEEVANPHAEGRWKTKMK